MKNPHKPVKLAAFSQYPRGYQQSPPDDGSAVSAAYTAIGADLFGGTPTTSQCIMEGPDKRGCTMGYTVVTRVDGCEYRYTEWADFNTPGHDFKVNWDRNVGIELCESTSLATRGLPRPAPRLLLGLV